jgi:hypothetical protein
VGHDVIGAGEFRYGGFRELALLPLAPDDGGLGLGIGFFELRWLPYFSSGDCDDVFLTELSAELGALTQLPRDDDFVLLPARHDPAAAAALIATHMRAVAPHVAARFPSATRVELAITPGWRLRAHELDAALKILREIEPAWTREWLLEQHEDDAEIWDVEAIEDAIDAIDDEHASFLLAATTWQLWHPDDDHFYVDDSCLYQLEEGQTPLIEPCGLPLEAAAVAASEAAWRATGDAEQADIALAWARALARH